MCRPKSKVQTFDFGGQYGHVPDWPTLIYSMEGINQRFLNSVPGDLVHNQNFTIQIEQIFQSLGKRIHDPQYIIR